MPSEQKAIVSYVELLKEDLVIIRFVPKEGMPDYQTGQFLTLSFPIPDQNYEMVRRAYSICSHPENKKFFELVIRWVRKPLPGRATTQLFYLGEGDEITFGPPTGADLTINDTMPDGTEDNRRIVCVGGGTGIAPFVAFVRHLHDVGDKRELVILHGASYVDELSYKEEFTSYEEKSIEGGRKKWKFRYAAAISRPKEQFNRSWNGQTGRVESFVKPGPDGESPLEKLVGEKITPKNTMFYICGYQGTIDGVMDVVKEKGFVDKRGKREDGGFDIKWESYG